MIGDSSSALKFVLLDYDRATTFVDFVVALFAWLDGCVKGRICMVDWDSALLFVCTSDRWPMRMILNVWWSKIDIRIGFENRRSLLV